MSEFEKQVRKALIDHGWKLVDLAEKMDISVSYLYDLITGNRSNKDQVLKIRQILEMGDG